MVWWTPITAASLFWLKPFASRNCQTRLPSVVMLQPSLKGLPVQPRLVAGDAVPTPYRRRGAEGTDAGSVVTRGALQEGAGGLAMGSRSWRQVLWDTARTWTEDRAFRMAAALSFYSIMSLAPLLLIATALAGL